MRLERLDSMSDRSIDRLLRWGAGALAGSVLAFGLFYAADQQLDGGPGPTERQVAAAEAAVRSAPGNVDLRLALAASYALDNRLDAALEQYDQVLGVEPDNRAALLGKGAVLHDRGDLEAATAPLTELTTSALAGQFAGADLQLQEALYRLGSIDLTRGQTEPAVAHLRRALSITPTDSDALYLLGTALLAQGSPAAAIPELRKAVMFVPTGWCEPYQALRDAYGRLGRPDRQRYAAAMLAFCSGDEASARTSLTALANGPASTDALVGLGLIAEESAARADAAAWYGRALERDPDNTTAASGLARMQATGHGAGHGSAAGDPATTETEGGS
jgi:tetratricopeptide (TPR) repeat protein